MRYVGWRQMRQFHRDPSELHGLVAVILAACFFLALCAATVKADSASSTLSNRDGLFFGLRMDHHQQDSEGSGIFFQEGPLLLHRKS